jgi:hypothetical protein
MLDGRGGEGGGMADAGAEPGGYSGSSGSGGGGRAPSAGGDLDDDIPF